MKIHDELHIRAIILAREKNRSEVEENARDTAESGIKQAHELAAVARKVSPVISLGLRGMIDAGEKAADALARTADEAEIALRKSIGPMQAFNKVLAEFKGLGFLEDSNRDALSAKLKDIRGMVVSGNSKAAGQLAIFYISMQALAAVHEKSSILEKAAGSLPSVRGNAENRRLVEKYLETARGFALSMEESMTSTALGKPGSPSQFGKESRGFDRNSAIAMKLLAAVLSVQDIGEKTKTSGHTSFDEIEDALRRHSATSREKDEKLGYVGELRAQFDARMKRFGNYRLSDIAAIGSDGEVMIRTDSDPMRLLGPDLLVKAYSTAWHEVGGKYLREGKEHDLQKLLLMISIAKENVRAQISMLEKQTTVLDTDIRGNPLLGADGKPVMRDLLPSDVRDKLVHEQLLHVYGMLEDTERTLRNAIEESGKGILDKGMLDNYYIPGARSGLAQAALAGREADAEVSKVVGNYLQDYLRAEEDKAGFGEQKSVLRKLGYWFRSRGERYGELAADGTVLGLGVAASATGFATIPVIAAEAAYWSYRGGESAYRVYEAEGELGPGAVMAGLAMAIPGPSRIALKFVSRGVSRLAIEFTVAGTSAYLFSNGAIDLTNAIAEARKYGVTGASAEAIFSGSLFTLIGAKGMVSGRVTGKGRPAAEQKPPQAETRAIASPEMGSDILEANLAKKRKQMSGEGVSELAIKFLENRARKIELYKTLQEDQVPPEYRLLVKMEGSPIDLAGLNQSEIRGRGESARVIPISEQTPAKADAESIARLEAYKAQYLRSSLLSHMTDPVEKEAAAEMLALIREAKEIASRKAGKDIGVYIVGGGVRDVLLGKMPNDMDVAVVGGRYLFMAELRRVLAQKPGTDTILDWMPEISDEENRAARPHVLVLKPRKHRSSVLSVETVNLKVDAKDYGKGPPDVEKMLKQDASKRNITVNALYAEISDPERVIDPTGLGLDDMHNKTIRLIGISEQKAKRIMDSIASGREFGNALLTEREMKSIFTSFEKAQRLNWGFDSQSEAMLKAFEQACAVNPQMRASAFRSFLSFYTTPGLTPTVFMMARSDHLGGLLGIDPRYGAEPIVRTLRSGAVQGLLAAMAKGSGNISAEDAVRALTADANYVPEVFQTLITRAGEAYEQDPKGREVTRNLIDLVGYAKDINLVVSKELRKKFSARASEDDRTAKAFKIEKNELMLRTYRKLLELSDEERREYARENFKLAM